MRQVTMAALAAALAAVLSPAASATGKANVVSSNWAGYALVAPGTQIAPDPGAPPAIAAGPAPPATFTSVTGTWTQPKVRCAAGSPTYSAVWVGLGGLADDSQALEQIGTGADCTEGGTPIYHAWYELLPSPPVDLSLVIRPGDTITTSVNVDGTNVLLQIKNRTRRATVTRRLTMAAPGLGSAEWIVEAPAQCGAFRRCRPLPLADFGSVAFARIAATGNGHAGTITDPSWTALPIELAPSPGRGFFGSDLPGSQAGALPSPAAADGRSFSVAWQARAQPASTR